jgi:hypothetical protein
VTKLWLSIKKKKLIPPNRNPSSGGMAADIATLVAEAAVVEAESHTMAYGCGFGCHVKAKPCTMAYWLSIWIHLMLGQIDSAWW